MTLNTTDLVSLLVWIVGMITIFILSRSLWKDDL